MRLPTYSIITATLNAAGFVDRSLASVLRQSVPPRELIVVDGGSTDDTRPIVERAARIRRRLGLETRVRVLHRVGGGLAGAWNRGIARSRGEVIFLLNADDWLEPDAARKALSRFATDPEVGIVHAKARIHDREGTALGVFAPTLAHRMGLNCRTVHCSTFVRREVYERVGGFDPRFRTTLDYDFIERAWAAGIRFSFIDEVLANFRLGGISSTEVRRADWETLCIGLRHSRTKIPSVLAYALRRAVLRPLGFEGLRAWAKPEPVDTGWSSELIGLEELEVESTAASRPAVASVG
jgi:cellulose synthase/poly-beta-1,6-N-acetylglucosamine synthase-like glycosyltransferase